MKELRIDPEFRDKIPPLTDEEFRQLEENIVDDGEIYEPIIVWNGTIVDGHNRYKIAQKHPEIPFKTKEMDFPDKWAAFDWMYAKQLGRRNLTEELQEYCRGKMLEARKKTRGAPSNNKNASKQIAQNGPFVSGDTAQNIANELGVSRNTVKRSEKFSKGVDAIRDISPEAANKILSGTSGTFKQDIRNFTKMGEDEQKKFVEAIETGEKPKIEKPKPKRNPNSDRGNTKEDRAIAAKVAEAVAGLSSDDSKGYTLDILLNELEVNGAEYVRLLQNAVTDHPELMTEWNKPVIAETIQTIINNIINVKESIK